VYVSCGCEEESAESGDASLDGWPQPSTEFMLSIMYDSLIQKVVCPDDPNRGISEPFSRQKVD